MRNFIAYSCSDIAFADFNNIQLYKKNWQKNCEQNNPFALCRCAWICMCAYNKQPGNTYKHKGWGRIISSLLFIYPRSRLGKKSEIVSIALYTRWFLVWDAPAVYIVLKSLLIKSIGGIQSGRENTYRCSDIKPAWCCCNQLTPRSCVCLCLRVYCTETITRSSNRLYSRAFASCALNCGVVAIRWRRSCCEIHRQRNEWS